MGVGCFIKTNEEINVIWIDPNINNEENTKYCNELISKKSLILKKCDNVNDAIVYMKGIKFVETKVIVSGKLYSELIEKFKKNILDMCIAPKIIVFTKYYRKKEFENEKNIFYKFGGVAIIFDEIRNFLKSDINIIIENEFEEEKNNNQDDVQLIFEYIDCKEKLMLPMFFKVLIDNTSNNNMEEYTNYLYRTFSEDNEKIKKLLSSIISIPNIPIEILSKFYARLYTCPSNFHSILNRNLGLNKTENYLSFIKTLYQGVKSKALPLSSNKILYRGSKISKDEITKIKKYIKDKIEGLPGAIVFSRAFLSFSKNKKVAENFFGFKNTNENLSKVLFVLEKDSKIRYNLSTHGDIQEISYFFDEEEVLFFPFSN